MHSVHEPAVIEGLWTNQNPRRLFNGERATNADFGPYFDYYAQQWRYYFSRDTNCFEGFDDNLTKALKYLKSNLVSRHLIVSHLETQNANQSPEQGPRTYQHSVNFLARLLVMVRLGRLENEAALGPSLEWEVGPLKSFLATHFCQPPKLECDGIKLPKVFNAWTLQNVSGIKIDFTDNLADHLRLVGDDDVVLVFHHASFLDYQNSSLSSLPSGLADETLRTMALLFPQLDFDLRTNNNNPKKKWFGNICKEWHMKSGCRVDGRLACCGTLSHEERQIETFAYWRDRLVILKQSFDIAKPQTFSQWWHDRRNGAQWYPFWIATMAFCVAVVGGVLSLILAGFQVYKAYYPS